MKPAPITGSDRTGPREFNASGFRPIRILEVEISQPLPDILPCEAAPNQMYEQVLIIVRLHTQPLGTVELPLEGGGLSAAAYAQELWRSLGKEIRAHLGYDGLSEPATLGVVGLPSTVTPKCLQERASVLAKAPFVSVVVATHDRPEGLASCLRSLLSLDYPNFEIIVVDNAPSSSATADLIRETYGSVTQVRYVLEDQPGLGWARNRGLQEVQGEIVASTDDDVVVDKHWLAELVKGFTVAEHVGCVTGIAFPLELRTQPQVWFEQFGGFNKGYSRRVFDLTTHRPKSRLYPYSAGKFGTGANMAFRTAALRAMGGFDPALGAGSPTQGGEDLAAFFQIIMAGYTLVYEPGAIVHHLHRRDYAGLRKQAYGYGVGLTAYLTKCLIDKPTRIFIVPTWIVAFVPGAGTSTSMQRRRDFPRELTKIERKGLLHGPFLYIQSRWKTRLKKKQVYSTAGSTQPAAQAAEQREELRSDV